MSFQFPINKDVDQAQEKILQAQSAQEIKDLLKQDDPQKPNFQEGLVRLVTQHIMKQIPPEEIANVENAPFRKINAQYGEDPFSKERTSEFTKLGSKMDSDITFSIVTNAAQKHDPYMVSRDKRDSFQPPSSVGMSIAYAVQDHIKNYSPTIDEIFDKVLPKIKQEKSLDNQNLDNTKEIEIARKTGYVQGVCECVAVVSDDPNLGKKLLSEMKVDKDMAKKFANPETYKTLEKGIFSQKQEQTLEQTQRLTR